MADTPDIDLSRVAQICHGDETYGVGSVQRLYANCAPEMLFVCTTRGKMFDWLRQQRKRVLEIDGPDPVLLRSAMGSARQLARLVWQARRTGERAARLLAKEGIRIFHAHWLPQQLMGQALRHRGIRCVWHLHNNMSRGPLGVGELINNLLARSAADLLIPVSHFIARNWLRSGVPAHVIHNAAPELPSPPVPVDIKLPLRCLVVGRLTEAKGIHLAVDAVARARQLGHQVTLDVFGGPLDDNRYATFLRSRIDELEMSNHIVLKGYSPDLRTLHAQYHLGFQCRIDPEPCSVWVCEAMVDGLPLIASATGGTPELITEGDTGLLFDPNQSDAASMCLLRILGNINQLSDMRQKARLSGLQRFTPARFMRDSTNAYQKVLAH